MVAAAEPVSMPDLVGRGFTDAQVADLPGGHGLGHGADGLLDRHRRVDAVEVVQVDAIGSEPAQGPVDRTADAFGSAVEPDRQPEPGQGANTGLSRDDDVIAVPPQSRAQDGLAGAATVHLGRVEQSDPGFKGMGDGPTGRGGVGPPVGRRHAQAAQTDVADIEISQMTHTSSKHE